VVVTPHLGASTTEAQDKAGETIGEMVVLALHGDFVPFAVNVAASEASESVRPFLPLAERVGRLFTGLAGGAPDTLHVEYEGEIADYDCRVLTLAVLKGVLGPVVDEPVSFVNAPQSNVLSAAEHTLALLLAQARNVPQANADLKAGAWNRSKWEGVELHGKTLGIVGLGRVGVLVAQRAHSVGRPASGTVRNGRVSSCTARRSASSASAASVCSSRSGRTRSACGSSPTTRS